MLTFSARSVPFGQGMGDVDIAQAFAYGQIWFKVPPTVKIVLKGTPSPLASAKDIILAVMKVMGANGLLGYAAEFTGEIVDNLNLASRITMSSMVTEMGGIIGLFMPNDAVIKHCEKASGKKIDRIPADDDAIYEKTVEINIDNLQPMISRPGHPEDVIEVSSVEGTKVDSVFVGSCTNGRIEDMRVAAEILKHGKVAPAVVMKIVPATDDIWRQCLDEGLVEIFKDAGALLGNAGCAGCAAGQIGQNGPGEVTISTGNRNFAGKQGMGEVYLASPAVATASAVAGAIALPNRIPEKPALFGRPAAKAATAKKPSYAGARPTKFRGKAWVINNDNIDTDMIYHNRHLAVTDIAEMGQFCFGNLKGYEDFAKKGAPRRYCDCRQKFRRRFFTAAGCRLLQEPRYCSHYRRVVRRHL